MATKRKKKPKKLDALHDKVLEHFDHAVELEAEGAAEDAARAFADGIALARTRWTSDAEALAADVDLTLWRANLAITLQGIEAWDRMLDVTKAAVAEYPPERASPIMGEAVVLCLHATALQHVRALDEALAVIDRAIALDPEDADSHHERACILAWKGDVAGALASMRRSVKLDPHERPEKLRDDADLAELHGDDEFEALTRP
jgi:tetratricopeptide (TPR) repeat protein